MMFNPIASSKLSLIPNTVYLLYEPGLEIILHSIILSKYCTLFPKVIIPMCLVYKLLLTKTILRPITLYVYYFY
jgi:hypothetical protein